MSYFDFEISFMEIEPRIWRRLLVAEKESFYSLHIAIQEASSEAWYDGHLWDFSAPDSRKIIARHPDTEMDNEELDGPPAGEVLLKDFFKQSGQTVIYSYDYGDNWQLTVKYCGKVKSTKRKPFLILDGQRAFPPDDCGGIGGYEECLAATGELQASDFDKEELESRKEWLLDWKPDKLPVFDNLE